MNMIKIGTIVTRLEVIGLLTLESRLVESFLWIISVVFICLMESEKVLTKIKLYIWIQPSWKITVFRVCPTARRRLQKVNVCLQWIYMKFPGKNQLFRELSSGEPAQSNLQQQFNLRSKSPLLRQLNLTLAGISIVWTKQPFNFLPFYIRGYYLSNHPWSIQKTCRVHTLVSVY